MSDTVAPQAAAEPGLISCAGAANPSLASLIDFYWRALLDFQNCLEDIEGADGRIENLRALRWKFLAAIQSMEASLGGWGACSEVHRAASLLQTGAPTLRLSADELMQRLCIGAPDAPAGELESGMLSLGRQIIAALPGHIPAAQGATGQREIIRAMRMWTKAAEGRGVDMGFLARRLEELG